MTARDRVVFDCNVYFQAMISPFGPAGQLLAKAVIRQIDLFLFFDKVTTIATLIESVPSVFTYSRDPDDAHYVDLAVAAGAKLIVSRDKDLLSLADVTTPEGQDFRMRFPDIEILTPPALLRMLEERRQE
jgi:predicted nucleic acid-binding protein